MKKKGLLLFALPVFLSGCFEDPKACFEQIERQVLQEQDELQKLADKKIVILNVEIDQSIYLLPKRELGGALDRFREKMIATEYQGACQHYFDAKEFANFYEENSELGYMTKTFDIPKR